MSSEVNPFRSFDPYVTDTAAHGSGAHSSDTHLLDSHLSDSHLPDSHQIGARPRRRAAVPGLRRVGNRWSAALSRPTFGQIHGKSPMETTCIVRASVADVADALNGLADVEWGRGRGAGRLRLEPFRGAPAELGRPWVANATLEAHGARPVRVTVAIFKYGSKRCGIQVRPGFRRPRSSRRLRRRLRSTHGAADRLRELVLEVDFAPPGMGTKAFQPA